MPKVGDRVVVEGNKIGAKRREGTLLGTAGSLIRVRWADETESLFSPGAGSVSFLPGGAVSKPNTTAPAAPAAASAKPKSSAKPGQGPAAKTSGKSAAAPSKKPSKKR